MSVSTAPRDLAAIKHALELGLILATLIIATIMIVTAAHDDGRMLTSDITTGQVMQDVRVRIYRLPGGELPDDVYLADRQALLEAIDMWEQTPALQPH